MFHNNTVALNDMWYESHASVIRRVCLELGQGDKSNDLLEKILGQKLKMKAQKDPNKPKRPKSAFLLFCDDERPKLIEKQKKNLKAGEKFNLGDIQKKLGSQWGKLSDDKKKKYNEQCETCKETYFDKMSEYESQLDK